MTVRMALKLGAILGVALIVFGAASAADTEQPLSPPRGPVILTVIGNIRVTNAERAARFDRAMLEALPQTTIVSYTDWTEDEQIFGGVLLVDLLDRIGAKGQTIAARALNDFTATIPLSDLERHRILLALTRNGEEMPTRDKGPIWIIYPNDQPAGSMAFEHNEKMVWQLTLLDVR